MVDDRRFVVKVYEWFLNLMGGVNVQKEGVLIYVSSADRYPSGSQQTSALAYLIMANIEMTLYRLMQLCFKSQDLSAAPHVR